MYAFENTWHVVALIGGLATARTSFAHSRMLQEQKGAVLEFIDSGLIAVLLVFCVLRPFVVQAFFIPSSSMEPTLQIHDRILVNKFVYYFTEPSAGDVVVFDAPPQATTEKKDYIKRVVGVPGDRIAVKGGRLYRNGQRVQEPYTRELAWHTWPADAEEGGEVVVPPGHVVVFGDNRNNSHDSHAWGMAGADGGFEPRPFLARANILGKATVIFWPPKRIRLLD